MYSKKTFIEKAAIGIIIFVIVMMFIMFGVSMFIGINIANNPEVIGEWLNKLIEKI